jgi:hypothetical protein
MPKIYNNTEQPWSFPIPGVRQREVMRQKAVDGLLVEEKVMESYPVAAEVKVLGATLSSREREFIDVTKDDLKAFEQNPVFRSLVENRDIEVH